MCAPSSPAINPSTQHNDVDRLRRWADIVAFAIDNPGRENIDALLELAEQLEDALEAAIAAERAA